jgi:hypothetical protein
MLKINTAVKIKYDRKSAVFYWITGNKTKVMFLTKISMNQIITTHASILEF